MIKLGGTGEGRGRCPLPDVLPPSATCSLHFNCFPMHNCAKDIITRNSQVIGILMYTWRFPQNSRVHTLFVENRQIQIRGQPDVSHPYSSSILTKLLGKRKGILFWEVFSMVCLQCLLFQVIVKCSQRLVWFPNPLAMELDGEPV